MARIGGVDLPNEKRVEIGLTYIYGIGKVTSNKVLEATGINPDTRVKDLTEEQIGKIREYMDKNLTTEGELRRVVNMNIKALEEIQQYRAIGTIEEFKALKEKSIPRRCTFVEFS